MTQRERSYTLGGTILAGVEARLDDVHTSCPGRVVRYDASKQLADVQPLVQRVFYDEAGARQTESPPVVTNVPVCFPGAGGFRITFPIVADDQTGDTVLLVFADCSLDKWLSTGGKDVDPEDERRFHLSDAMAIPGLRDFAHALSSAPTDRMTVGKDGGLQLHIDGSKIRIGDNDAPNLDTAALGGAVTTALGNVLSYVQNHTHPLAGVQPGPSTLTTGPTTTPAPSLPNVESGSVMVKK